MKNCTTLNVKDINELDISKVVSATKALGMHPWAAFMKEYNRQQRIEIDKKQFWFNVKMFSVYVILGISILITILSLI